MQQASETGVPALRPLFMDFPNDPKIATTDDEFMFGSDLLVAPVLWEGATSRGIYLPPGGWYDYWTGQHYSGPATFSIGVTLDSIPMFVRGGGFIFRQPVVQNTGQMPGNPLRVLIAPASNSSSSLYEDDGESLRYREGHFMKRKFTETCSANQRVFEISAPEGKWRPAKRDLILETWMDRAPTSVTEQAGTRTGETLPQLNGHDLATAARGWAHSNGMLTIKGNDRFEAEAFEVRY
jgi:alpha-glucosidase